MSKWHSYDEGYRDGSDTYDRAPRERDEVDFLTPYYIGGYDYACGFHDAAGHRHNSSKEA